MALFGQGVDRLDVAGHVLHARAAGVLGQALAGRPKLDGGGPVAVGVLGHPQEGVLLGRQLIQAHEVAIEGFAALEVGDVDPHGHPPVSLGRGVRGDDQLHPEAAGIGHHRRPAPVADGLEDRRRIAMVLEALRQHRLVGEGEGDQSDARRIVERAPRMILAALAQAAGELDLAGPDLEQQHLLAAAELDRRQRLQPQHLVVELHHLVPNVGREAAEDIHRVLREHRLGGLDVGRRGDRLGDRDARGQGEGGGEEGGLQRLGHGLAQFGRAKAIRDWLLSGLPSGPFSPPPAADTTATYCRPSLPR